MMPSWIFQIAENGQEYQESCVLAAMEPSVFKRAIIVISWQLIIIRNSSLWIRNMTMDKPETCVW